MDEPRPSSRLPGLPPRRAVLKMAAAGLVGLGARDVRATGPDARASALGEPDAATPAAEAALARAIAGLRYLTSPEEFREFEREKPRIGDLPPEKLRSAGLDRETWRLEVVPDLESGAKVDRRLSKGAVTALDWDGLMKLAETRAVRFLAVLSCTNMDDPIGMGLWEGVPLRDVIWMARPSENIRRVEYHGFHNDDPKQLFQSSLPLSRVLEDPPGELPVILCYKLNGQWLSARNGGPVRMVVPEAYGNKWIKWLQRVVLTNSYEASDTYARWNNDVESPLKTCARFLKPPRSAKAGQPMPLVGFAQVGMSGLRSVQYSVQPEDAAPDPEDPYLTRCEWKEARILPPPEDWGGGLPDGKLPPAPLQLDPETRRPRAWPLKYAIAHWAALAPGLKPGQYRLRCRTIDSSGSAQPMPRPLPRSGNNAIEEVPLLVEA